MNSQQKMIGVRSSPAYIFHGAWALCDQLLLCDLVLFELDKYDPQQDVSQMYVDYGKIARRIRRFSMSPSRAHETAVTCYSQLFSLTTSVAKATNTLHADPYSLVLRSALNMRQVRISELAVSITMCKDRLRIYAADQDFALGRPLNPRLLEAVASHVPTLRPRSLVFFDIGSVGNDGSGFNSAPTHSPATSASGEQSKRFVILNTAWAVEPASTSSSSSSSSLKTGLAPIIIPPTALSIPVISSDVPSEIPPPRLVCTLTVVLPNSSTHVTVYSTPRMHNQSILRLTLAAISAHPQAGPFLFPVNESIAPGYLKFVRQPMDLETIKNMLDQGSIPHCFRLFELISLVFHNCYLYNARHSDVWLMSRDLDTFSSMLFQGTFPEYAELFPVSIPEPKKSTRKTKSVKSTSNVKLTLPTPLPGSESVFADHTQVQQGGMGGSAHVQMQAPNQIHTQTQAQVRPQVLSHGSGQMKQESRVSGAPQSHHSNVQSRDGFPKNELKTQSIKTSTNNTHRGSMNDDESQDESQSESQYGSRDLTNKRNTVDSDTERDGDGEEDGETGFNSGTESGSESQGLRHGQVRRSGLSSAMATDTEQEQEQDSNAEEDMEDEDADVDIDDQNLNRIEHRQSGGMTGGMARSSRDNTTNRTIPRGHSTNLPDSSSLRGSRQTPRTHELGSILSPRQHSEDEGDNDENDENDRNANDANDEDGESGDSGESGNDNDNDNEEEEEEEDDRSRASGYSRGNQTSRTSRGRAMNDAVVEREDEEVEVDNDNDEGIEDEEGDDEDEDSQNVTSSRGNAYRGGNRFSRY